MRPQFAGPDDVRAALDAVNYLPDEGISTAVYLSLSMGRPLLLEGDPGVGKTALAAAIARITKTHLIRLSCYEGIDATQALYSWDFPRQILHLRAVGSGSDPGIKSLYTRDFLLSRPLLQAIEESPCVLLLDEIDRADDEFEALLLEILADGAITIPEIGTIKATVAPLVVLTSNRTREVHDALKRRCIYHWVEHPSLEREIEIVQRSLPAVAKDLIRGVVTLVREIRHENLIRQPGVAESIDWARAVDLCGGLLDEASARKTLGAAVKYREDQQSIVSELLPRIFNHPT